MLYGTIKKYRAGNQESEVELYTEFVEVIDEAATLSEFIKFIRAAQSESWQEPCFKLVLKSDGTVKRVIKEYSLPVDE